MTTGRLPWTTTPSGAEVAVLGDVVVKVHHPRTDGSALARRLEAVRSPGLHDLFVQPLVPVPEPAPGGRWATSWPHVTVIRPDDDRPPWDACGALLARLHRVPVPPGLPAHGGVERVARAVERAGEQASSESRLLVPLGECLLRELAEEFVEPVVVHGDWHLGQVGVTDDGLRLLDVDDLGAGAAAWDLGRPAGFWAAGLLDDGSWEAFLDGYRSAGGPAVPTLGDPWPALDLAARTAVFVAAVREVARGDGDGEVAQALLTACAQM